MNEMVERVARALHVERHRVWNELGGPHPEVFTWEMDNEPFREQLRVEARAFIASMREPDNQMLIVGAHEVWAFSSEYAPTGDSSPEIEGSAEHVCREAWRAMIDEALK